MTAPDVARSVGFDVLLQLPGAGDPPAGTPSEEDLAPAERERAYQVAARRLAFQVLYEIDLGTLTPGAVEQRLAQVDGLGPMLHERVLGLVRGAYERRGEADAEFVRLAPEWPTHRQPAVDRAILRLAHYELTTGITPAPIVINEAVELARHYSTEKSPSFVNALLDKVMKRLSPGGGEAGAKPAKEPA
jgi:N utilization substance protein B